MRILYLLAHLTLCHWFAWLNITKNQNDTHVHVPKTHSQSKILPKCWWFYTSAACDACDKYHVWIINWLLISICLFSAAERLSQSYGCCFLFFFFGLQLKDSVNQMVVVLFSRQKTVRAAFHCQQIQNNNRASGKCHFLCRKLFCYFSLSQIHVKTLQQQVKNKTKTYTCTINILYTHKILYFFRNVDKRQVYPAFFCLIQQDDSLMTIARCCLSKSCGYIIDWELQHRFATKLRQLGLDNGQMWKFCKKNGNIFTRCRYEICQNSNWINFSISAVFFLSLSLISMPLNK